MAGVLHRCSAIRRGLPRARDGAGRAARAADAGGASAGGVGAAGAHLRAGGALRAADAHGRGDEHGHVRRARRCRPRDAARARDAPPGERDAEATPPGGSRPGRLTARTTRSCSCGCSTRWWTARSSCTASTWASWTTTPGRVLAGLPGGRASCSACGKADMPARHRRAARVRRRDADRRHAAGVATGRARGRARSCWSRRCRWPRARWWRRSTSSRSRCCPSASGASTGSSPCRRRGCGARWSRGGAEYVKRAVIPFLPARLRYVPPARAA